MSHIDEWIELNHFHPDYNPYPCFVHKLAVVAVLPAYDRTGGAFVILANGNQFRVKESVQEVLGKLVDKEEKHG